MLTFALLLLSLVISSCALSLFILVLQVGNLVEILEDWIGRDDDGGDGWAYHTIPRQPVPPDGMAKDIEEVRMDLARQYQKN